MLSNVAWSSVYGNLDKSKYMRIVPILDENIIHFTCEFNALNYKFTMNLKTFMFFSFENEAFLIFIR